MPCKDWFRAQKFERDGFVVNDVRFPVEKPPAVVFIDDRCLLFTGKFPSMEELVNFRPWNKRGP